MKKKKMVKNVFFPNTKGSFFFLQVKRGVLGSENRFFPGQKEDDLGLLGEEGG